MPYCGEKYAFRIRNTIGGTLKEPCRFYCNMPDWESWRQAMETFQGEVVRKASDLRTQANRLGRGDVFDRISRLYVGPAQNAVAAAQGAEPTGLETVPGHSAIVAAVGKCTEAMNLLACALEQVDLGYTELRLRPPVTPGAIGGAIEKDQPPDWMTMAKRAGIAVGVGALGYLAIRYWLTKRLIEAQARARPYPPRPGVAI